MEPAHQKEPAKYLVYMKKFEQECQGLGTDIVTFDCWKGTNCIENE